MTPPPAVESAAETRRRIASAARDLFLASGFSTATMDDIARELGMSKKTLYEHFPGKAGLLREAARLNCAENQAELDAIEKAEKDFFPRARRTFDAIAKMYSRVSPAYLTDLKRNAPEVWNEIQEFRRTRVRARILALLETGARQGVLRDDLDPEALAAMYLTMTSALLTPETSGLRSGAELAAAFEAFAKVFRDG
ncbi:MAG: TetR/AcrR family transcriptional regulator, partial [Elusimicrobia bacterium]|nr:TetR/AcrR family transcriptional regulator [Elusimicrobiota bacterium]